MTAANQPNVASASNSDDDAMTLSGERLVVTAKEWAVTGTVAVRRRVVTETKTIQVTVRREELVVDPPIAPPTGAVATDGGADAGTADPGNEVGGDAGSGGHSTHAALVIVLSEEVPEVSLSVKAYEQVTVYVDPVSSDVKIPAQLRREVIDSDAHITPAH